MRSTVNSRSNHPKGTGSRIIYEALQERILGLRLLPGEAIDEERLIKEFGVSRTPVREALIRLEADGMLQILPNQGVWVSQVHSQEIPELLEAVEICVRINFRWSASRRSRGELSAVFARLAEWEAATKSENITIIAQAENALHELVAAATHNRFVVDGFRAVMPSFLKINYTLLKHEHAEKPKLAGALAGSSRIYDRLTAALSESDAEKADNLAQTFMDHMRTRVGDFLGERE